MKLIDDIIFFILFFLGIICLEFPINLLHQTANEINMESKYGIFIGVINMYVCIAFLIGYLMIVFSWIIIMFFGLLAYCINYFCDFVYYCFFETPKIKTPIIKL